MKQHDCQKAAKILICAQNVLSLIERTERIRVTNYINETQNKYSSNIYDANSTFCTQTYVSLELLLLCYAYIYSMFRIKDNLTIAVIIGIL